MLTVIQHQKLFNLMSLHQAPQHLRSDAIRTLKRHRAFNSV